MAEFETGRIELAFLSLGDVIFLCSRFGVMPWCDAPYSWHLNEPEARTFPDDDDTPPGMGAILLSILVDASTGIVTAFRGTGMGHKFTLALNHAIREQAAKEWCGEAAYREQISNAYRRFPNTRHMLLIGQSKWKQQVADRGGSNSNKVEVAW